MSTAPIAQGPVDVNVRPVAWMHDQPERYDVVHNEAKALWLKAWPKQVEHYTIPLYRHERREPLSTDAACALLKDALGIDPLPRSRLDRNVMRQLNGGRKLNNLQKHTPRVDAVIDEAMAKHPGESAKALQAYFEAVHQELAPLARDLERENEVLRLTLAAAMDDLKKWKALVAATEHVSEIAIRRKERAERLGLTHNAK